MKKRLAAFALLLVMLVSFVGCGGYPEIAQSESEARVVARIGDYSVTYDLFLSEFLTFKTQLDGGNEQFWVGKTEEQTRLLLEDAAQKAFASITSLYAVFALCKQNGIDPYGPTASNAVTSEINALIDALSPAEGEDRYEAYRKMISSLYMNDHVFRLQTRASVCEGLLIEKLNKEGKLYPKTKKELVDYFMSDDTACVIWMYRDTVYGEGVVDAEIYLSQKREEAIAMLGYGVDAAKNYMCGYSNMITNYELEYGRYVGRYKTEEYDLALAEAAFALEVGEISPVIRSRDGVYVLLRLAKNERAFDNDGYYAEMREYYASMQMYRMLDAVEESLAETLETNALYDTLSLGGVKFEVGGEK